MSDESGQMTMEDVIKGAARERSGTHANPRSTAYVDDFEEVGLAGEVAFAELCGLMFDTSSQPNGDGGRDFLVPMAYTFDVKTSRKPYNLIHRVDRPFADICVLAKKEPGHWRGRLLGWEWGLVLQKAPIKVFGDKGVLYHYIAVEELRPIAEIDRRIMRLRMGP